MDDFIFWKVASRNSKNLVLRYMYVRLHKCPLLNFTLASTYQRQESGQSIPHYLA